MLQGMQLQVLLLEIKEQGVVLPRILKEESEDYFEERKIWVDTQVVNVTTHVGERVELSQKEVVIKKNFLSDGDQVSHGNGDVNLIWDFKESGGKFKSFNSKVRGKIREIRNLIVNRYSSIFIYSDNN